MFSILAIARRETSLFNFIFLDYLHCATLGATIAFLFLILADKKLHIVFQLIQRSRIYLTMEDTFLGFDLSTQKVSLSCTRINRLTIFCIETFLTFKTLKISLGNHPTQTDLCN